MFLAEGEFTTIVGRSGSGKTTLLQILGTILRADSGTILFRGRDLDTLNDLARFRAEHLGFVFQLPQLFPVLTALENVMLTLLGRGLNAGQKRSRALEMMALAHIESLASRQASVLSAGEQQRVSICRALVHQPRLVLADEPTGNLDSAARSGILELFQHFNRVLGVAFLVVTHDPEVVRFSRRNLILEDGCLSDGAGQGLG